MKKSGSAEVNCVWIRGKILVRLGVNSVLVAGYDLVRFEMCIQVRCRGEVDARVKSDLIGGKF